MKRRIFAAVCAFGMVGTAALGADVPTQGPGPKPGLPGWYYAGSPGDPEGTFTTKPLGYGGPSPAAQAANIAAGMPPRCAKSVVCEMVGDRAGGVISGFQGDLLRVSWKHTPGRDYAVSYPLDLKPGPPPGYGQVTGVGVDSKDNVWVWQRNNADVPALFKFGPDHKLILTVPLDITDHSMPFRGHGLGVDPEDNVWVINEAGAVIKKISPDGKLLLTLGTHGHRGDWDEAKGQHLLWEPVTIDFGPKGDVYIFESHGDESPNDAGSDSADNNIGASRVLHLTKDGQFINQWYGDVRGPAKFNNAHGSAVDPVTGNVWVGDREDYRIVIFNADGKFIRTIQMRNLICALRFDTHKGPRFGQLWLGTGMDGQIVRLDRNTGDVLFVAAGTRRGDTAGHFMEATNMGIDTKGDLWVGDTQLPRATLLTPPGAKAK